MKPCTRLPSLTLTAYENERIACRYVFRYYEALATAGILRRLDMFDLAEETLVEALGYLENANSYDRKAKQQRSRHHANAHKALVDAGILMF